MRTTGAPRTPCHVRVENCASPRWIDGHNRPPHNQMIHGQVHAFFHGRLSRETATEVLINGAIDAPGSTKLVQYDYGDFFASEWFD